MLTAIGIMPLPVEYFQIVIPEWRLRRIRTFKGAGICNDPR